MDKLIASTMQDMNRVIDELRAALKQIRDAPVCYSSEWHRNRADEALKNWRKPIGDGKPLPGQAWHDAIGWYFVETPHREPTLTGTSEFASPWQRGDRTISNGQVIEFIEAELEGEKWKVIGPAPSGLV